MRLKSNQKVLSNISKFGDSESQKLDSMFNSWAKRDLQAAQNMKPTNNGVPEGGYKIKHADGNEWTAKMPEKY